MQVDYSLYLVTDSTMIPESSTFLKQVEAAIDNGATLVQLREKSILTTDFVQRAKEVHELTLKKGIPLIINDRIDVALAIDAEGVHIGQDDMPPLLARKLIGPDKILGLSCSFPEHVKDALALNEKEHILDYLGMGTVFQTQTKKDLKDPNGSGPSGVRRKLQLIKAYNETHERKMRTVAIGGINHTNAARVLHDTVVEGQSLDGIAVVSCIMANENAAKSTRDLLQIIKSVPPWHEEHTETLSHNELVKSVRSKHPLVHHITNDVVKNFSANVTLAIGGSPIMSELLEEFSEFATKFSPLALVANIGTPTPEQIQIYREAFKAYNLAGHHIIYDPVAAGASNARLNASHLLLNSGHMSVIKGNLGEIASIWKLTSYAQTSKCQEDSSLMHGVDLVAEIETQALLTMARQVSADFKCVVVVTGKVNHIVYGDNHSEVPGGHPLMGSITGSGCSLGSVIAAFVAANGSNHATVTSAVKLYNEAGREAAKHADSPGTFVAKFIDYLYKLSQ